MKNTAKDYFTPGELAKLTGISKQILLYYDKNNIFSPSFVDDKGYRYYSLSQYFSLEILITMRKLDIPLQDIMAYLHNKNLQDLKQIYSQKLSEYRYKIKQLQQYEAALEKRLARLDKIENIRLDQIMLSEEPEQLYYQSKEIFLTQPTKIRILKIAEYMLPHLRSQFLEDCVIGFSLNKNEVLDCGKLSRYRIFVQIDDCNIDAVADILCKKSGLYLSLYCNCHYGLIDDSIKLKIKNFLELNHLKPCSDIFVFPLRNYWSATTTKEEISKICLQVEYI